MQVWTLRWLAESGRERQVRHRYTRIATCRSSRERSRTGPRATDISRRSWRRRSRTGSTCMRRRLTGSTTRLGFRRFRPSGIVLLRRGSTAAITLATSRSLPCGAPNIYRSRAHSRDFWRTAPPERCRTYRSWSRALEESAARRATTTRMRMSGTDRLVGLTVAEPRDPITELARVADDAAVGRMSPPSEGLLTRVLIGWRKSAHHEAHGAH